MDDRLPTLRAVGKAGPLCAHPGSIGRGRVNGTGDQGELLTDAVGTFWALGRGMQRGLRQAPSSYMLQLAVVNG